MNMDMIATAKEYMSPEEYVALSARTCKMFPEGLSLSPDDADILHAILGMSGEVGELVDGFKKHLIYGKPLDGRNLEEEAGDVLWYMALLFRSIQVDFSEVMHKNIEKLKLRYPDKYTDAHAVARADKIGEE